MLSLPKRGIKAKIDCESRNLFITKAYLLNILCIFTWQKVFSVTKILCFAFFYVLLYLQIPLLGRDGYKNLLIFGETMEVQKIYYEDLQIAEALIKRDNMVTRKYFYQQCYPLFKSIYDNYYTDCINYKEFIDEIYIVVLAPSKTTGKCQMENFRGESTLASWIKTACLYYCYKKYELKQRMPIYEPLPHSTEKDDNDEAISDRKNDESLSNPIDFSGMNRADVEALLNMMPNIRYRNIIRLLYLEQKTHKEVAEALGMTMDNYYNKRILAEKQYKQACRKEEANV